MSFLLQHNIHLRALEFVFSKVGKFLNNESIIPWNILFDFLIAKSILNKTSQYKICAKYICFAGLNRWVFTNFLALKPMAWKL